ncbi:alpha-amylase [Duganella sp. FT3S]|uniref:Alpha-amylase n=1 Tax=Rugamonas fusca TaxID=2758568 RepID=A0A7W2ELZ2_9BURK|nr:alpha-amylase family glycosyl hydrolase [Rugamonas fusca]MBA5608246.1 alpha-amylase [Rugamonas fusca]
MKKTPLAMTLALALSTPAATPAMAVPAASGTPALAAPARAAARPFLWENATVYFLLTDRFNNGNRANDLAYGRQADAAPLRGYMGGDLAGVTAKINEGYFDSLGVTAIWITPPVEQIHGGTDEGTGKSYGFHGYWARDWTSVDANLGTEQDMRALVDAAHAHGIRVLLDVVMNQTGPVTEQDPVWPPEWVRTGPVCTYKDPATTISCTLVPNLPDVRTESNDNVDLPPALVAKWKAEGRYEREVAQLDAFFARTGYPRAPRYYLIKWHADWVRKYGFDGFRADTVKHVEAGAWKELGKEASLAYEEWKRANPARKLGDDKFFMVAELFGYNIANGQQFDLGGGHQVNYYKDGGFDGIINFGLVWDAKQDYETLFSSYAAKLHGELQGHTVLNYLASHDFDQPFDPARIKPFESANKLLLAPGAAQIYYGDETARRLDPAEAQGDAKLRSFMNWDDLASDARRDGYSVAAVRRHWAKLALFRKAHVAVGAGVHQQLQAHPYVFKRTFERGTLRDKVVVALEQPTDKPSAIDVHGVFADGARVRDYYSGTSAVVAKGKVTFPAHNAVVLIGQ